MLSIPLYLSHEHECNYLAKKTSCSAFVHPSFPLTAEIYSQLLEKGFRRSGSHVYRPHCPSCTACIPLRIPVQDFKPSRIQKRTIKKNAATQITVKPAKFEQKHYDLYCRYQRSRHSNGNMAKFSPDDYMNFLSSHWCETCFIEMTADSELIGIAVTDRFENSLSAVYTFFDPAYSQFSPGVFSILWQISYARELQLDWLYLGFWIERCSKMSYKTNYRPIQALIDNHWIQFAKHETIT